MGSKRFVPGLVALLFLSGIALSACVPPSPAPEPDPLIRCTSFTAVVDYSPLAHNTGDDITITIRPGAALSGCTDRTGGGITSGAVSGSLVLPGYLCEPHPAGSVWGSGTGRIDWSDGSASTWRAELVGTGTAGGIPAVFTFTGGRWTGATASIEMRPITSDGDCTTTPVSTASFANTGPFVLHPANPAAPAPIGGAVQLALADLHSCARLSSGAVQCWGYNGFGQLADGTHTDSSIAVTADGIPGTIGLAASVFHNCGVFAGGSEGCWSPFAVAMTGAAPLATGVATGNAHSCMIVPGGGVRCQGADNSSGQLGDGTTTGAPHGTDVLGIGGATALAAGFDHSCALLGDRTVRCWGANASGQLGDGTTDDRPAPVEVTGVTGAVAVSAYGSSSCALIDDGTVRCWGDNSSGQLGNGTTISTSHPVVVLGVTGATALGEGGDHGCAVVAGGSVRCWGENSAGQLGDGTTVSSPVAVTVQGLTGATAVAAGGPHTCALVAGGGVRCWGSNTHGQLGDASTDPSAVPVTVIGRP